MCLHYSGKMENCAHSETKGEILPLKMQLLSLPLELRWGSQVNNVQSSCCFKTAAL